VDRNQAILAELGLPDVQHAVGEIDISAVQAQRLAGAQSCAGQQSDHGCQHQGTARIIWRNMSAGRHQQAEFLVAQYARRGNGAGSRQRLGIKGFGPRIIDRKIIGKAPNNAVAAGAAVGRAVPGQHEVERHCPRQRAVELLQLNVADQRAQDRCLLLERKAERPAEGDVSLDPVGKCRGKTAHLTPPGNGRATSAS
jgi:hypothetical protein